MIHRRSVFGAAAALLLVAAGLSLAGCATRGDALAARGASAPGRMPAALAAPGAPSVAQGSGAADTPSADTRARIAPLADAGPLAVDIREMDWLDERRQRTVPVRLYLPRSTGPVPLVVFSHGLGGSRYGYSHLGRYWASHGIAALHVQHAGSDRAVWSGQGLAVFTALRAAATPDNAIARAKDVSFALDQVLADPGLRPRLDPGRIGVAGHSFGANTALLAAGARFRLDGVEVSFGDARVRGAIVMSAPSLPADQDPDFVYAAIRIPTLHLTGTRDETPIPGLSTMPEERRVPFDTMAAGPRWLGVYDGGRHSMFNDWARDPTSETIKASTRVISLAFWRSVFESDGEAMLLLAAPGSRVPAIGEVLANWEARP